MTIEREAPGPAGGGGCDDLCRPHRDELVGGLRGQEPVARRGHRAVLDRIEQLDPRSTPSAWSTRTPPARRRVRPRSAGSAVSRRGRWTAYRCRSRTCCSRAARRRCAVRGPCGPRPGVGRGRAVGGPAARARRGVRRQDDHPGVRLEGRHRQPAAPASPRNPYDPAAHRGRLQRRQRGGGRAGRRARCPGHRRRRLGAHPGLLLRHLRASSPPTGGSRSTRRAPSARWRTSGR